MVSKKGKDFYYIVYTIAGGRRYEFSVFRGYNVVCSI